MDFLVIKKDEVIGKISFNDTPGNLMNDFFAAFAREPNRPGAAALGLISNKNRLFFST